MNVPECKDAEPCADVANIPESQLWTTREPYKSRIKSGLEWAALTEPTESNLEDLVEQALGKD